MADWDKLLFGSEFASNSTYQETIKGNPFELDLGFIPDGPSFVSGISVTWFSAPANELALELKTMLTHQDNIVESHRKQESV